MVRQDDRLKDGQMEGGTDRGTKIKKKKVEYFPNICDSLCMRQPHSQMSFIMQFRL